MSSSSLNTQLQPSFNIVEILGSYKKLNELFQNQTKIKAKKIIKKVFETFPDKNQIQKDQKEKAFVKKEIREFTIREMIKHHVNDEMEPTQLIELWDKLTPLDLDEDVYQKALKIPGELLQKLLSFDNPRQAIMRCINCQASFLTYSDMLKVPDELLEACLDLPISDVLLQDLLSKSQEIIREILALKDVEEIKKRLSTDNSQSIERSYSELVESRLCASKNKEAPFPHSSLTQHEPILIESLKDQKVKNKTFMKFDTHISFQNDGGFCKGMTNWFVMLYFILQSAFQSPAACLTAITSQFKKGAEDESILMQSLAIRGGKLIDLHIDESKPRIITSNKLYQACSPSKIVPKFDNGVYLVLFRSHRCVYFQLKASHDFYFDPNKGLFKLPPETHDQDLILLLQHSCKNKSKHCVEFIHCQPRDSFPKLE